MHGCNLNISFHGVSIVDYAVFVYFHAHVCIHPIFTCKHDTHKAYVCSMNDTNSVLVRKDLYHLCTVYLHSHIYFAGHGVLQAKIMWLGAAKKFAHYA
jgi:hypothetical protein